MTFRPPKAPRRNEYLKNGNFCRNVLVRLIAPKPHLQMQTSPSDRPFLSCLDPRSRSRAVGPKELASDFFDAGCGLAMVAARRYRCGGSARVVLGRAGSTGNVSGSL